MAEKFLFIYFVRVEQKKKLNLVPTISQDINCCHKWERVTYLCVMLHPGTEYSISWDKPDADGTILLSLFFVCRALQTELIETNAYRLHVELFHTELALPARIN